MVHSAWHLETLTHGGKTEVRTKLERRSGRASHRKNMKDSTAYWREKSGISSKVM